MYFGDPGYDGSDEKPEGSLGVDLIVGLAILLIAYGIKQTWEYFHG